MVIVIAAYNEADGLPAVVAALPARCVRPPRRRRRRRRRQRRRYRRKPLGRHPRPRRGLPGTNRGQGAALRLGYRIARNHGAAYVITTDADGQYDVSDLPALLTPILEAGPTS